MKLTSDQLRGKAIYLKVYVVKNYREEIYCSNCGDCIYTEEKVFSSEATENKYCSKKCAAESEL